MTNPTTSYHTKSLYRLYSALFLLATLWLGTETWKKESAIWLVMFLGVGFITLRLLLSAFARASFDGSTFTYHTPLGGTHQFGVGQLALAEMGGRRNEALIIGYHPLDAAGRIDLEHTIFINCAPLENQGALLDLLLATLPGGRQNTTV